MANGHGGMRRPASPAPVSGPGALARRTDGGPATAQYVSGLPYGDGQDFYDLQTSAPLGAEAAKTQMRSGAQATQGGPSMTATPLFAPTARPDEPVTAGAPFGPGENAAPQPAARRSLGETLTLLAQYDQSGEVARMAQMAVRQGW